MLKDNLGIRLFALFLAILIWLQSVLVSEHRSVVSLPVNLRNMPQNITLENLPQSIPFAVKGKGLDIIRLMMAKPRVNIDAASITPNTEIISLENYVIDMPENVDVSLLGPADTDQLAIQADVFHRKTVNVELTFADALTQSRMKELRYTLNPSKVTIFGPKSRITNLVSIKSKAITQDMLADARHELELQIPGNDISVSDKSVLLSISGAQESSKVYPNIALVQIYTPSSIAVRLSGPGAALDRLAGSQIKAVVSEEADEAGLFSVDLILPDDIQVIAITPDKVRKRR